MRNILIVFLIVLNLLFATSIGYAAYQNRYIAPTEAHYNNFSSTLNVSNAFVREPALSDTYFDQVKKNPSKPKIHGWIPTWSMAPALKKLEEKRDYFASVSPLYYSLTAAGILEINKPGLEALRERTAGSQTKIIPTLTGFDASATNVFLSQDKLDGNINAMIKDINDNNYDGVDIDFESIQLVNKDQFFKMLQRFKTAFNGKKILSVSVLTKWSDTMTYGYAPETRKVLDYPELAKYVDQLRVMTYDFTGQGSTVAGPVAPIKWIEQVLDYTVKRVPREKVILGVNLYGYVWPGGVGATALDYRQVAELKQNNSSVIDMYSDEHEEAAIRYSFNGKNYFGFYATPKTVQARLDLAEKYGIEGISCWRIGNDPL